MTAEPPDPALADLHRCFEGAVPAVIATADSAGLPNITYLSRVHMVDSERIALSNQFFSKTARNLAENPRASVVLIDPITFEEYRLRVAYERTERRGPVFDRLSSDVDALAALEGMEDVFKLRAADIYRVLAIERMRTAPSPPDSLEPAVPVDPAMLDALGQLTGRLARCGDLDTLVDLVVDSLSELLGYEHSLLLLADEEGRRLYTIASHGYEGEGIGSEVVVGQGPIGMTAARCTPLRVGSLRWMSKYSRSLRRSFEGSGELEPARSVPVPGLRDAQSLVAVPAMAMGRLVGVLMVESPEQVAFTATDETVLSIVAGMVAAAVEAERAQDRADGPADPPPVTPAAGRDDGPAEPQGRPTTAVRFYRADGSTFVDGDYVIKGVAGRILWSLLGHHEREGRVEFTNREMRLDPSLELPPYRDNFESRLILLKRRLDERACPIRVERVGRGRFRLHVDGTVRLEPMGDDEATTGA